MFFFFFQAEDGIRDKLVTGVQTCALPIYFLARLGSDDGVRGALAAYDAETGKEVWRFWTVPGDPAKGFETKELEMASKTWFGEGSWKIGGGGVWHAITDDDSTRLVIFCTPGADVGYREMTR